MLTAKQIFRAYTREFCAARVPGRLALVLALSVLWTPAKADNPTVASVTTRGERVACSVQINRDMPAGAAFPKSMPSAIRSGLCWFCYAVRQMAVKPGSGDGTVAP